MHWDVPGLFSHVCSGLAEALRQGPDLIGIGVDSWAVDYGLLRNGALAAFPIITATPGAMRASTSCTQDTAAGSACPQRITVPPVQHGLSAGRR
jgi:hypothetical protein